VPFGVEGRWDNEVDLLRLRSDRVARSLTRMRGRTVPSGDRPLIVSGGPQPYRPGLVYHGGLLRTGMHKVKVQLSVQPLRLVFALNFSWGQDHRCGRPAE